MGKFNPGKDISMRVASSDDCPLLHREFIISADYRNSSGKMKRSLMYGGVYQWVLIDRDGETPHSGTGLVTGKVRDFELQPDPPKRESFSDYLALCGVPDNKKISFVELRSENLPLEEICDPSLDLYRGEYIREHSEDLNQQKSIFATACTYYYFRARSQKTFTGMIENLLTSFLDRKLLVFYGADKRIMNMAREADFTFLAAATHVLPKDFVEGYTIHTKGKKVVYIDDSYQKIIDKLAKAAPKIDHRRASAYRVHQTEVFKHCFGKEVSVLGVPISITL